MTGVVTRVFLSKGYGWILGDDNQSWFLHATDFSPPSAYNFVREGQKVTFECDQTEKGLRARNIQLALQER